MEKHQSGLWWKIGLMAFVFMAIVIGINSLFGVVIGALLTALCGVYLVGKPFRQYVDQQLGIPLISKRFLWAGLGLVYGLLFVSVASDIYSDEQKELATRAELKAENTSRVRGATDGARGLLERGQLNAADLKLREVGNLTEAKSDQDYLALERQIRDAQAAQAKAAHEADLARLPQLIATIEELSDKKEWSEAQEKCEEALKIEESFQGLAAACEMVSEGLRQQSIPLWAQQARELARDKTRCDTLKEIQESWQKLKTVKPNDNGYKAARAAVGMLEKCRRKVEKTLARGINEIMQSQRETWANQYELGLLDKGIDARVTLSGKYKTRVKIRWVLLSRPNVYQITKDGTFLENLEKSGFVRVTFSDGYSESWRYDLSPPNVIDLIRSKTLAPMGLDKELSI